MEVIEGGAAPLKDPPNVIEEIDALTLEKLSLERDLLQAQMQNLDHERHRLVDMMREQHERGTAFGATLRAKYQISDADRIDISARKIERV